VSFIERTGEGDERGGPCGRVGWPGALVVLLVVCLLLSAVSVLVLPGGGPGARAPSTPPRIVLGAPRIHTPVATSLASPHTGVGSVVATLDLTTNHLFAGNQQPAEQGDPQMVLYDPSNGDFYVRGSAGQTISVVNASTNKVLTSLTVGTGGSAYIPNVPTMATDLATGDVYETNPSLASVGIIQAATNRLAGSISLGTSPGGIVFDASNGNLYTSNWYADNVSIISAATNQVVGSVSVGGEPGAILYDPIDQEVFVSNFNTGNVSVIDTTTEKVVANPRTGLASAEPLALVLNPKDDLVSVVNSITDNITVINGTTNAVAASVPVGSIPTNAIYAPSTDTLWVANGASDNLTVLQQPGNAAIASIGIGHDVQGAAYDPVNGFVYTANFGTNNVSIVNSATDAVVGSVTTSNFPACVGIDSGNGSVYVGNEGTVNADSNLTVISGSTTVAGIDLVEYPTSLTAAPNGDVYSIDYGGQDAAIISESTNLVTGIVPVAAPEPTDSAYDTATGDLFITSEPTGAVTVVTAAGVPVTVLNLGFGSYGVAYDPSNGYVYVSNYYSGNITVIDGATDTVSKVISVAPFNSLGAEIYDPADSSVFVADYSWHNVTVVSGEATTASIQVGNDPSSFAYDPANDTIFVADYGSGNISVINASTNQVAGSFSSYAPSYLAYDPGTNSVYVASFENGAVYAYNASTYASLGAPLVMQSSTRSGDIAYGSVSGYIYVSNEYDSSISILSGVNSTTYPVTFQETGLPPGTGWSVLLNGTSNATFTSTSGFVEPNGTYPFTVEPVPGYTASPANGHVTVAGSAVEQTIQFTATQGGGSYGVAFHESGLPPTTSWSVTLNGTPQSSSSVWVNFTEGNGSYSFTVGAVSGYASSPSSGTLPVAGVAVVQDIVFSTQGPTLAATLSATPASVAVGSTSVLATTASGGAPPYSYVYSGLPTGCATANAASVNCVPSAAGTFGVSVTVTDSSNAKVTASATLTVTGPNSASSSSGGVPIWGWALVVVAILVVLALFFFFAARRKKKNPTPEPIVPMAPPPAPPPP
jgi:YVTN family beta-propeller protein